MKRPLPTLTALVLTFAACTEAGPTDDPEVATVAITAPAATMIDRGATLQLEAIARDADGVEIAAPVAWTTSDDAIATVSATGLVTAREAGAVIIAAAAGSESASVELTVRDVAPAVARVELRPAGRIELRTGATMPLVATAYDAGGEVLVGRTFTWASDGAAASVAADGVVTAVAPGTARVTAACEGRSAEVEIVVANAPLAVARIELDVGTQLSLVAGETQALGVTAYAADGTVITGRPIVWSTSAGAIAAVSAAGVVEARAGGLATITATVEDRTDSVAIVVRAPGAYALATIGGQALPAVLFTILEATPAGNVPVRYEGTSGTLTLVDGAARYTHVFWAQSYRGDEAPVLTSFEGRGDVVWTGSVMHFVPDDSDPEVPGGVPMMGQLEASGDLRLVWRPYPEGPGASLVFAR